MSNSKIPTERALAGGGAAPVRLVGGAGGLRAWVRRIEQGVVEGEGRAQARASAPVPAPKELPPSVSARPTPIPLTKTQLAVRDTVERWLASGVDVIGRVYTVSEMLAAMRLGVAPAVLQKELRARGWRAGVILEDGASDDQYWFSPGAQELARKNAPGMVAWK